MSLSLYDATVPLLIGSFKKLDALLDKAAASGIPEADLLEARLAPDMLPFTKQVQIASDTAKGAVARLAQVDAPKMEDNEASLADLKARIAKTVAFIESVDAAKFDGGAEREVVLDMRTHTLKWVGVDYLRQFVLPNFYFHVAVAYSLLRMKGVQIGKQDWLPVDPAAATPKG